MKKVLFAVFTLSTTYTASLLLLPKLILSNLLVFVLTSATITGLCIWVTIKIFSSKKLVQSIQIALAGLCFALSSIAIFFVEYPFWISVPEDFCNSNRAKARVCKSESEITHQRSDYLPIYVVGHSWHTGLMFRTKDLPRDMFSGLNLSEGPAIEIGWGSEAFYRATNYTIELGLNSFVFPNPSVTHVVTLPNDPELNFSRSDLYVYWASRTEFERALQFVAETFNRDDTGSLIDLGPGIYGNSRFYKSTSAYHFPKSCNTWTARALYEAGAPIWPSLALTARNTLHQVRLVSEEIRRTDGLKIFPN